MMVTKNGKNEKDTVIMEEDRLWKGSKVRSAMEGRQKKIGGGRTAEEDRSRAAAKMNVMGRINTI